MPQTEENKKYFFIGYHAVHNIKANNTFTLGNCVMTGHGDYFPNELDTIEKIKGLGGGFYGKVVVLSVSEMTKEQYEKFNKKDKVFVPIPFSRELHYICAKCGHHNIVFGHPKDSVTSKCENCKNQTVQTFLDTID